MRRRFTVLLVLVVLLLAVPGEAFAHGFGVRSDIPVPFWLYAYGASCAVVLTFLLLMNARPVPHRYPRIDLLGVGWFRAVFVGSPFLFGLRLLSVALFVLVILAGLLGNQTPEDNFAPTFVWIIWWVGLSFFTALVGNVWPLVNPWKIVFECAEGFARRLLGVGLEQREPYPEGWGVWPAVVLYAGFVWVELVFYGSSVPLSIALFAFLYSILTWGGMAIFGKDVWLREGEAFSVFFGILGRFAPTEVRVTNPETCKDCDAPCPAADGECVNCYECFARAAPQDRQLNLRPWAVGLSRPEPVTADRLVFIIFVLASVTYDGLLATPLWGQVQTLAAGLSMQVRGVWGIGSLYLIQTLGLVMVPLLFLAVYLGCVKLAQVLSGRIISTWQLAGAYAYTLVPIALAYQTAHYYTFLVIQGQAVVALISDPFGWAWDLFGTSGYEVNVGVISADFVWYSQVALIVVGHVIAVYLAHGIAYRLLWDKDRVLRSQYPMVALMVLYTIFSLWILNQPVVE